MRSGWKSTTSHRHQHGQHSGGALFYRLRPIHPGKNRPAAELDANPQRRTAAAAYRDRREMGGQPLHVLLPHPRWRHQPAQRLDQRPESFSAVYTSHLPVHHVEGFDHLPIPFHCVATDLETGEPVVLESRIPSRCPAGQHVHSFGVFPGGDRGQAAGRRFPGA